MSIQSTIHAYAECGRKGTQGKAIVWRALTDDFKDVYYVTFNNKDEGLALDSTQYDSFTSAKYTAHTWLLNQPRKAPPKGFQFASANPRTLDGERNDCVVRALSLAFNKPYEEIHALCNKVGRTKGKGMRWGQVDLAIQELTGNGLAKMDRPSRKQTFTTFARDHKVGSYLVIKSGHAVALIDGVFHDAGTVGQPRAIVKAVFKVK